MMEKSSVIHMPKRFDYLSNMGFNNAVSEILERHSEVILDFAELQYIDSAGIGLLVMAHKKAQAKHAKVIIIHVQTSPKEILLLANLQKIIEIQ